MSYLNGYHELMVVKSREEMRFARKAGALCDRALEAIAARARPGVTEAQLAAAAAHAIMDGGGTPHLLIIAATASAKPRAIFGNVRPSNRPLRAGDIIVNEIGAAYQGTSAQSGNPIGLGEPAAGVREFFEQIVVPGYRKMAAALKPGNTLDDVHRAGAGYFRAHGHQSRPGHLHGIDVVTAGPHIGVKEVHHSDCDFTLRPGMELMLEPCVIRNDGLLGIFLGRTYFITETGKEAITKYPIELTVVKPSRRARA